ncbi:hypothetical protein ACJX0J_031850, partial [Zea mays]
VPIFHVLLTFHVKLAWIFVTIVNLYLRYACGIDKLVNALLLSSGVTKNMWQLMLNPFYIMPPNIVDRHDQYQGRDDKKHKRGYWKISLKHIFRVFYIINWLASFLKAYAEKSARGVIIGWSDYRWISTHLHGPRILITILET